jgi:hypothetical protein
MPFQRSSRTASPRSSRPQPEQHRRTPSDVWQAAYSKAASCSTSLITRRPSAASISRSVAFSTSPLGPARRRSSSTMNAGASIISRLGVRLPADHADPAALPDALGGEDLGQRQRPRSRGWPGRLKSWNSDRPHRQRRGTGHARALVADQDRRLAVGPRTSSASSKRGSKPVRYDRPALCSRSA